METLEPEVNHQRAAPISSRFSQHDDGRCNFVIHSVHVTSSQGLQSLALNQAYVSVGTLGKANSNPIDHH